MAEQEEVVEFVHVGGSMYGFRQSDLDYLRSESKRALSLDGRFPPTDENVELVLKSMPGPVYMDLLAQVVKDRKLKPVKTRVRCPECGFHIRGPHHAEGEHHRRRA